jgi:lipoyl(octanoyl) transferase
VYVDGAKIASLGLRVRRGCSYHGLALNVDMDLQPFSRINPCGHEGLEVTTIRRCMPAQAWLDLAGKAGDGPSADASSVVAAELLAELQKRLLAD